MDGKTFAYVYEDAPLERVELAADGPKRYWKQIFKYGTWVHPRGGGRKMQFTREFAAKFAENFKSKVAGLIPLPLGHPITADELADKNRGEVLDFQAREDGGWVLFEVRDEETANKIEKRLITDVSMSFDENHMDRRTGRLVGPALRHVGLVVNPYLTDLGSFQPALSDDRQVIMLSESEEPLMQRVKNDRDFAVEIKYELDGETKTVAVEPGQEVEVPEAAEQVAKDQVAQATKPESDEEKAAREAAEKEAAEREAAEKAKGEKDLKDDERSELERLRAENASLSADKLKTEAESQYNDLLSKGKIVPAQKEAFINLATASTTDPISLADGSTKPLNELLTNFIEAGGKRVSFSEDGSAGGGDNNEVKSPWNELSDEQKSTTLQMGISEEEYNETHSKSNKE